VRPQTPFIWSIETPPSIMKVSSFGEGSLHSAALNIKGRSLRNCKGQGWCLPAVPAGSGYCDSEQFAMPVGFWVGVCMSFFFLGVGTVGSFSGCLEGFICFVFGFGWHEILCARQDGTLYECCN